MNICGYVIKTRFSYLFVGKCIIRCSCFHGHTMVYKKTVVLILPFLPWNHCSPQQLFFLMTFQQLHVKTTQRITGTGEWIVIISCHYIFTFSYVLSLLDLTTFHWMLRCMTLIPPRPKHLFHNVNKITTLCFRSTPKCNEFFLVSRDTIPTSFMKIGPVAFP